jgi:hypothetical protein
MEVVMSHSYLPADDEQLIARLGAVAREFDSPPPLVYELGRQVYQLHRVDDELVELAADSLLDSHAVRASTTDIRLLSFESAGTSIELEISREGSTSSILGQLTGAGVTGGGRAYLETATGEAGSAPIDTDGRFEFFDAPHALVRVRLEPSGAPSLSTSWVTL